MGESVSRQAAYLIVRPGAIGDAIVTLPMVQQLKDDLSACVHLVVGHAAAGLLSGRCAADAVSDYEDPRWLALFANPLPEGMREYLSRFSMLFFYLTDVGASAAERLERSLHIPAVVWPPLPKEPIPISYHLQGALAALGLSPRRQFPRLALDAEDQVLATRFLAEHGLGRSDAQPLVALHPGSGSPQKNWPAERFRALAQRLAKEYGARFLAVAGPADEAVLAALLCDWAGEPPLVARGLHLAVVGALLTHCRCLVGNDSGIAHLAAALGVPVVVIFGPTDPRTWAPQGPAVSVVAPKAPCAPCSPEERRVCREATCLKSIDVDEVYVLARQYMEPVRREMHLQR